MAQQTAVEFLLEQIKEYNCTPFSNKNEYVIVIPQWILNAKIQEALKMEKEQMMSNRWIASDEELKKITVQNTTMNPSL